MSTSLAALPAYKATKATRTKARTNRTIFGTTLDSYGKLSKLLNDEKGRRVKLTIDSLFNRRKVLQKLVKIVKLERLKPPISLKLCCKSSTIQ